MAPPPKRRRLTEKQIENNEGFHGLEEAPAEKQLQIFAVEGMGYPSLKLRNGDRIVAGDCVEIDRGVDHGKTSVGGEAWIAEVVEIKGGHNKIPSSERFVLANWLYSQSNVNVLTCRTTIENITRTSFGRKELLLSNHQQIIAACTIKRRVAVQFLNEQDRKQPPIRKNGYWYRFNLNFSKNGGNPRIVYGTARALPQARCGIDECTKRYNPDHEIQRLCPRESCGFWYHVDCLENTGCLRANRDWHNRRLEVMLKGTKQFMNDFDEYGNNISEVPREFYTWIMEGVKAELEGVEDGILPQYANCSISNVVWCAQTPINRGIYGGIVGNEKIIVKARKILREIRDDGVGGWWPDEDRIIPFKDYTKPPKWRMFSCPRCGLGI